MRQYLLRTTLVVTAIMLLFGVMPKNVQAQKKTHFVLACSVYTGWMPCYYANEVKQADGMTIFEAWAKSRGITVEVRYMDYVPSIEAFIAGGADAVVITNMDAMMGPVAGGISTRVLLVGDYSNGNDRLIFRGDLNVCDVPKHTVLMAERSVSEYLLEQALIVHNCDNRQISNVLNVAEGDLVTAYVDDEAHKVAVTWNPFAMRIVDQVPGAKTGYDSSSIPGHILDMLVANDKICKEYPAFCEVLVGGWGEVLKIMSQRGQTAEEAIAFMAERSQVSVVEFEAQLRTTAMLWTPQAAIDFASGSDIKKTLPQVREFCFERGWLGEDAPNAQIVGLKYPDGTVDGDEESALIFDTSILEKAAKGELTR